jgi:hypothetical protein
MILPIKIKLKWAFGREGFNKQKTMDNIDSGRRKKKDKAKEKEQRNGHFSAKHVRLHEKKRK